MDCRAAGVTVRAIAFEVIPLWLAVILLEPVASAVPRPAPFMLNVAGFEEVQEAEFVRFCVVPSLNVPIAAN
jgi:hypothetical protein